MSAGSEVRVRRRRRARGISPTVQAAARRAHRRRARPRERRRRRCRRVPRLLRKPHGQARPRGGSDGESGPTMHAAARMAPPVVTTVVPMVPASVMRAVARMRARESLVNADRRQQSEQQRRDEHGGLGRRGPATATRAACIPIHGDSSASRRSCPYGRRVLPRGLPLSTTARTDVQPRCVGARDARVQVAFSAAAETGRRRGARSTRVGLGAAPRALPATPATAGTNGRTPVGRPPPRRLGRV